MILRQMTGCKMVTGDEQAAVKPTNCEGGRWTWLMSWYDWADWDRLHIDQLSGLVVSLFSSGFNGSI